MANIAPMIILNSIIQRTDGSGIIDIEIDGIDENYNICKLNLYEYSNTGDFTGEQKTMTFIENDTVHSNINRLPFTLIGSTFTFTWNAFEDLGEGFEGDVYIRLRANDNEYNSNIVSDILTVDLSKPIIVQFNIDTTTEKEEDITVTGIVDLLISVINANSMKFSNNGIDWSSYEPYSTSKNWNLILGNGGQPFQGLKKVYFKVKDSYGNETDGTFYDSSWYKLTNASVENKRTGIKTHSIKKSIENAEDGDHIEVQTDDTFFENFEINHEIDLTVASGFSPTIDMVDRSPIILDNIDNVLIKGFSFINSNDEIMIMNGCNNINIILNKYENEKCIFAINSSNLIFDKNIFKDGLNSLIFNNCNNIVITNNLFIRLSELAIGLTVTTCRIINNNFIDCYNCIENTDSNSSIVRNNIFFRNNGIVIYANPIWIIEYNLFWNNYKEYEGLVERWSEYNNFKADPKFVTIDDVNLNNNNYYLREDSPCVNVGSFKDAPLDDFNGNQRKQDINFDIGAFEYFPIPEYTYNINNVLQSNNINNVFIYDTTKDNINNSWCNSSISSSWYIEKGYFPEIVYLIITNSGLDIVNPADNSLWMRFSSGVDNVIYGNSNIKALFALDGIIYLSNGTDGGLLSINFINDTIINNKILGKYLYNHSIDGRNSSYGYSLLDSILIIIIGDNIKNIDVSFINTDTYVAVSSENGISVIKNMVSVVNYMVGSDINKVLITNNRRLYCILNNKINVFYNIDQDINNNNTPDYLYDQDNQFGPKIYSDIINDISIIECGSEIKRDTESNAIYVATDNGITVLHTCELVNGEKWGYSKYYRLKEDYDPLENIVSDNLLEINNGNHNFESGSIHPDYWTATGYPIYSRDGNYSFEGIASIRVGNNHSYESDVFIPVSNQTNYLFGAAIKVDQFESKAVIRIDWYTDSYVFISTSILDIGIDKYYRKYYANVVSPISSAYAKIILNGDGLDVNNRFWYDCIEFYEVSDLYTYINPYILEGNISNISHIYAFEDILLLVAKDNNNDEIYLYNLNSLKLKMNRTTSLPSRNISSLYYNKLI